MKFGVTYIAFVVLITVLPTNVESRGLNGGVSCAACTIVTGLIQQIGVINRNRTEAELETLCLKIPHKLVAACQLLVRTIEPVIFDKRLFNLVTPDVFCYAIGSCYRDPGQKYCHLFPRPKLPFHAAVVRLKSILNHRNVFGDLVAISNKKYKSHERWVNTFDFCSLPIVTHLCSVFLDTLRTLLPAQDFDKDSYSVLTYSRGAHWRGKDCDDLLANVHPGALPDASDVYQDTNCDGIWGINNKTGKPWQDELCPDGSKGLLYLGDSIGAHFHFPAVWMDPINFEIGDLDRLYASVMDELDWPELGFATGFRNTTTPLLIQGFTDSIYLRLRKRNRCSHRDYANISQNGAASWDLMKHLDAIVRNKTADRPAIVIYSFMGNDNYANISQNGAASWDLMKHLDAIVRYKTADRPAIVIYSFMGNDVCNRFQDTIANMTTTTQLRTSLSTLLRDLEQKLPVGSHLILLAMLDGSFIYSEMAERVHPLGSFLGNVLYKDVYRWFTCMEIGPCTGWMTPNETLRAYTTQRAHELNDVLQDVAHSTSLENLSVHYLDSPVQEVLARWVHDGGHVHELIDPIDSLHPNQKAQPLIAEALWKKMLNDLPYEVVGDVNPRNQDIQRVFGDQGGH